MSREQAQEKFRKKISNPFLFRLFLLQKLPLAFIAGVKVRRADKVVCTVSVPYKWLSQNPFRSIYFAALAMAAEMSTGILSMMAIQGASPALSMLVSNVEASFVKKADKRVYFTCTDGAKIFEAVQKAIQTGEGVTVKARSEGTMSDGTVVAEFFITWSFKTKSKK